MLTSTRRKICNFLSFVIDYLNQFEWYYQACRTVRLPPSYLRRGINGLELENPKMYVKTEDGRDVDFRAYNKMNVRPAGKSRWELIATHKDGSELNIATFANVEEAKDASTSLAQAADADRSWDAGKFKRNLETYTESMFKEINLDRNSC